MEKLLHEMKSRNSKYRLQMLKEEAKKINVISNGSPHKKVNTKSMYKLNEKIKQIEMNTDLNDSHSRFQLLT